ncbi:uncharacterized protein [Epargyreus clarus]|uniref:uncharacterized protein n=1 Tax=Epargyreus clarus TaxID=520877 RepID=UPI003C30AEB6
MANKCGACGRFASTNESVKCTKCSVSFHKQCVKISNDARTQKWQCRECKPKAPGASAATVCTPSPEGSSGTDTEFTDARIESADRGRCENADLTTDIKFIREQLSNILREMTCFRQEILKINKNLGDLSNRVGDVEKRIEVLEQRTSDTNVSSVASNLEESVTELRCQLNDRDQALFLTDVEITGVEETKGENLLSIVSLIATKIGVSLEERDVVSAMRTGVRRPHDNLTGAIKQRPRPLVVRLARRAVRDQLLKAARVRRGADTAGVIVGSEPRTFYINERLTYNNKQLFYKVRDAGRRKGWRYMWTRDGYIYARRDSESPRYRVRTDADINKIFGL